MVARTFQTLSFIKRRLAEAGIRLRHEHGQNFLVDFNLQKLIVRTAELAPQDVVLEIGTGLGALTQLIAPSVAAVVTVEVDRHLAALAQTELAAFPNVLLLQADALENKNTLNREMLAAVQQQLNAGADRRFKLVANLPFHVATPIITNLLALDSPPETMTVTIQKEVADRLIAPPATKDYGTLSVWVQSQCHVRLVKVLPPSVFWPRPKVHSAIVHIQFDKRLRSRIADLQYFHDFLRRIFLHRRKLLRSQLAMAFKELGRDKVDQVLASVGLTGQNRAEELSVEELIELAEVMCKAQHALD